MSENEKLIIDSDFKVTYAALDSYLLVKKSLLIQRLPIVCASHILSRFQTSHLTPASSACPLHNQGSYQAARRVAAFTLRYEELSNHLLLLKTTSHVAIPEPTVCRVRIPTRVPTRVYVLRLSRARSVSSRPRGFFGDFSKRSAYMWVGFPTR